MQNRDIWMNEAVYLRGTKPVRLGRGRGGGGAGAAPGAWLRTTNHRSAVHLISHDPMREAPIHLQRRGRLFWGNQVMHDSVTVSQ